MIVVHVGVAVNSEKTYSEYFVHGRMVLPVFQHAYLKCPMLYVTHVTSRMGIMQKHKDYL